MFTKMKKNKLAIGLLAAFVLASIMFAVCYETREAKADWSSQFSKSAIVGKVAVVATPGQTLTTYCGRTKPFMFKGYVTFDAAVAIVPDDITIPQANKAAIYDTSGDLVGNLIPRPGTKAELDLVTGENGEIGATSDTKEIRLFDGSTAGGYSVPVSKNNGVAYTDTRLIINNTNNVGQFTGNHVIANFTAAGAEVLNDTGFASGATYWKQSGAYWTFADGIATHAGTGNQTLYQQSTDMVTPRLPGQFYLVQVTVSGLTGTLSIRLGNTSTTVHAYTISANGTYAVVLRMGNSATQ
jgi:hypothetical protein